jgi:hypothetical protein
MDSKDVTGLQAEMQASLEAEQAGERKPAGLKAVVSSKRLNKSKRDDKLSNTQ